MSGDIRRLQERRFSRCRREREFPFDKGGGEEKRSERETKVKCPQVEGPTFALAGGGRRAEEPRKEERGTSAGSGNEVMCWKQKKDEMERSSWKVTESRGREVGNLGGGQVCKD